MIALKSIFCAVYMYIYTSLNIIQINIFNIISCLYIRRIQLISCNVKCNFINRHMFKKIKSNSLLFSFLSKKPSQCRIPTLQWQVSSSFESEYEYEYKFIIFVHSIKPNRRFFYWGLSEDSSKQIHSVFGRFGWAGIRIFFVIFFSRLNWSNL